MLGNLILLLILWAICYFFTGYPRLWTKQPDAWEKLIAQVARGGPEEWVNAYSLYSSELGYIHSPSGIKVYHNVYAFPIPAWAVSSDVPLSRAGRLALVRAGKRVHRWHEAQKEEKARQEVAQRIIQTEKSQWPF